MSTVFKRSSYGVKDRERPQYDKYDDEYIIEN